MSSSKAKVIGQSSQSQNENIALWLWMHITRWHILAVCWLLCAKADSATSS